MKHLYRLILLSPILLATGCGSPRIVDQGQGETSLNVPFVEEVIFTLAPSYNDNPPNCIAILPFEGLAEDATIAASAELVRKAIYAHLAPHGKKDVELSRIDHVLSQSSDIPKDPELAESLGCDTLLKGKILESSTNYLGVYSRNAIGGEVWLIRAQDGEELWRAKHVATSHGGSIPLSPIGLASGLYDAFDNVSDEQNLRLIDDLARRLVQTLPDNNQAVLADIPNDYKAITLGTKKSVEQAQALIKAIEALSPKEQKASIVATLSQYDHPASQILYHHLEAKLPEDATLGEIFANQMMSLGDFETALTMAQSAEKIDPSLAKPYFAEARALIKLKDLARADQAIVRAISRDKNQPLYYNTLGYISSLSGNDPRAIAAYQMALEIAPKNAYAFFNLGVTLLGQQDKIAAGDAFYGAGLAYIQDRNPVAAQKALKNLKLLASDGLDLSDEINLLETALERLNTGKTRDS